MSFPDDPSGAGTPPGHPVPPSASSLPDGAEVAVPASPAEPAAAEPPIAQPAAPPELPAEGHANFDWTGEPIPASPLVPPASAISWEFTPEPPPSATYNPADFDHGPGTLPGDVTDFEHGPGPLPGQQQDPSTSVSVPESEPPSSSGADSWWTSQSAPESPATDVVATFVPASSESAPVAAAGAPPKPPGPPAPPKDDDAEEDGMAQMSFLEHLEELRKRLLLAVGGVGVAFFLSLIFSDELWAIVFAPAGAALRNLGVNPPELIQISPMDAFQIMWMKLPILAAVFLSSPWILYQVWAFIAPGLYKKERRYAAPFVLSSAGLFILGGLFAYYIAFRYGLEFLIGLGIGKGVHPAISMNEYYDLFVDVMLGVGIIFEIPVLLFLLTLIRVANPAFLVRHSRYAILIIVILAAVITPTGDVFNLALFATPMIILFYVGIFASYILVLRREHRRFPWSTFFKVLGIVLFAAILILWFAARYYGYHIEFRWPFWVK